MARPIIASSKKKPQKTKGDRFYYCCKQGDFDEVFSAIDEAKSGSDSVEIHSSWPHRNQPLHFAAAHGNLSVVRRLIEKYGYDAQCRNCDRVTPLHFASLGGHKKVVEYLLKECHCDSNVLDKTKSSPLHYACYVMYDNVQYTQGRYVVLRTENADELYSCVLEAVKPVSSSFDTYISSRHRLHKQDDFTCEYFDVVKCLITNNCNPFVQNSSRQRPFLLEVACRCGTLENVQYLTDKVRVDAKANLERLLCIACKYDQVEIVKFLLRKFVTVTSDVLTKSDNVFKLACSTSNMATVTYFIERGITHPTDELLVQAAKCGADYSVLKYLVLKGECNPMKSYTYDKTPWIWVSLYRHVPEYGPRTTMTLLSYAHESDNFNLMKALVNEANVNSIDCDGNTPLHFACHHMLLDFVKYLVELEEVVSNTKNHTNNEKELPLHVACKNYEYRNAEIIKLVAPHLKCVNLQDSSGDTALHVACRNRHVTIYIIEVLINELNCDPNRVNENLETPLHVFCRCIRGSYSQSHYYASYYNKKRDESTESLAILKLISSCVDSQDNTGQTSLHIACQNGSTKVVQYLTQEKKCDQNIRDNNGQLALHIAIDVQKESFFYTSYSADLEVHRVKIAKLVSSQLNLNVNAQDQYGNTPLHKACEIQSLELIRYLTEDKNCNQNIPNKNGALPLHSVMLRNDYYPYNKKVPEGFLKMVNLVSSQTVLNINAQDENGDTPLHKACKMQLLLDLIRYLTLDKRCDQNILNNSGELPLHIMLDLNKYRTAKRHMIDLSDFPFMEMVRFVSNQDNLNIDSQDQSGNTPLHEACILQNCELIRYLISEKKSNPNIQNNQSQLPLHIIVDNDSQFVSDSGITILAMARLVSSDQHIVDVNAIDGNQCTPLHIACRRGNLEVVKYLVFDKKCCPRDFPQIYDNLEIHVACKARDNGLVQIMSTKENINVKNQNGELPLHVACRVPSLTIAKMVADCDVNCLSLEKEAPLHLACRYSDVSLVEFLVDTKHCDPWLKSANGNTALHFACMNMAAGPDIVRYLFKIENFSELNIAKNNRQEYPVHLACTTTLELVELVGDNLTTVELMSQTNNGFNCLHIASSHGLIDIVEYLIQRECSPLVKFRGIDALGSACGLRKYSINDLSQTINYRSNSAKNSDFQCHTAVVKYLVGHCGMDPATPQSNSSSYGYFSGVYYDSLLEFAFKLNNLELLKALTVLNVNCIDNMGNTSLHIACKLGKIKFVEYLVQQGCDQTIQNHESKLGIHLASSHSLEIVKLLNECDVNAQCSSGDTALHVACRKNKEDIVEYLIHERNCNTSIPNNDGNLPLHIACTAPSSISITKHLVKANCGDGIVHNLRGKSPVHIACESRRFEFLHVLANPENIDEADAEGNTPLHIACRNRHMQKINWLLTKGANTGIQNANGDTPIHVCIGIKKPLEALRVLLNENSTCKKKNNNGDLPIHIACREKKLSIIQYLSMCIGFEESLVIKNREGDTPLHIALKVGASKLSIIQYLSMYSGFEESLVIKNLEGDTPLHVALKVGASIQPSFIQYLSTYSGFEESLVIKNLQGDTPLHVALKVGAPQNVVNIVSTSDNCNVHNENGNTPLHLAFMSLSKKKQKNQLQIVENLIKLGCDSNLMNKQQQISLHIAAMHSSPQLVSLVANPVRIIANQDKDGNSPLHLACHCGNLAVVQYLFDLINSYSGKKISLLQKQITTNDDAVCVAGISTLVTQRNNDGDSLLHLACRSGSVKLVQYLVKQESLKLVQLKNVYGETPLHVSCYGSSFETVKLVATADSFSKIFDCTFPTKYKNSVCVGDTPIHIACRMNHVGIVQYLLQNYPEAKKALSIPNFRKEFPIHILTSRLSFNSLIISSRSLSYLSTEHTVNLEKVLNFVKDILKLSQKVVNEQTVSKDTVLHNACKQQASPEILKYLIETIHCKVDICNSNGDLPLHLLCRYVQNESELFENIKLVELSSTAASLCGKNEHGNTPLHEICKHNSKWSIGYYDSRQYENIRAQIVNYLLEKGSDILAENSDHETAIHLACRYQTLSFIKAITNYIAVISGIIRKKNTLIHQACLNNSDSLNLVNFLATDLVSDSEEIFLNHENMKGETPLHLACKMNNLEVVKLLVSKGADVSHADHQKQTPITLVTDPFVIAFLLEQGADPTPLYGMYQNFFQHNSTPLVTPLNLLVIGDPGVGKTTLVQSLKRENDENITQMDTFGHTAGVIPNPFSSNIYGEVTMYDFAGHSEYCPSHGGVIHNIIKKSPPVILVLVNLTQHITEMRNRALYWGKFVLDYCASLKENPHLIVIGSHADVLRAEGHDPNSKIKLLWKYLKTKISNVRVVFKDSVSINCTRSQSTEIDELRKVIKECSDILREKTEMKFSSHCLYVFLRQQFHDRPAVRLDYLLSRLKSFVPSAKSKTATQTTDKLPNNFLPTDPNTVSDMCEDLSERAHILFIKHPLVSQIKLSWIILQKDILLHEVIGTLFAPQEFPQHTPLANSTGVVPFSKLKILHYDVNLLTGFLSHMEYCQEIQDPETLHLLDKESECQDSLSDRYFFFPSLVSIERPEDVWSTKKIDNKYHCGLLLECTEPTDFLNPQFIQVLLLRLAFGYAVPPTRKRMMEGEIYDITEKRVCSVWKSGIHWINRNGICTLVDVINNNKILILMQCIDDQKTKIEFQAFCTAVLTTILRTKREICPCPPTTQYVLHPTSIQHPLPQLKDMSLFTMLDIKATIEGNKGSTVINDQQECSSLRELLVFEPYAYLCKAAINRLYDQDEKSLKQVIPEDFLRHICNHFLSCFDCITELINPCSSISAKITRTSIRTFNDDKSDKLLKMFKKWQKRSSFGGTFLELRQVLDKVSFFAALGALPAGPDCTLLQDVEDAMSDSQAHGYLTVDHLKKIRTAIWDAREKWFDIGVELDLKPSTLHAIEQDYRKVDRCFTMMLETWLEQPEPTWTALIEALKSPTVDCSHIAESLKE